MQTITKKTIWFNLLTILVLLLTSYATIVPPATAAWFSIVVCVISGILNMAFLRSGEWVANSWSVIQWIVIISGIALSAINMAKEFNLVNQNIILYVTSGLTIIVQYLGKKFPAK
jgi:hypothetical protein